VQWIGTHHQLGVLTANLSAAHMADLWWYPNNSAFHDEPLIDVGERSGQLRPYVRPVARHLPLAITGVR
jgi:hypothetical protein